MMRKLKFGYCLLQYEHNHWLKERLNIGVLLFSPNASYLKLKTRGWDGRILAAYPQMDRANYTEDLKQIDRSINRFSSRELGNPNLFSLAASDSRENSEAGFLAIAQSVAPDMDSSYRWTFGGVGICKDLDSKLEQVYERFITPFDKQKPEATRSDGQVWSTVNNLLVQRELAQYIEEGKVVQTELGPVKFHAAYQNGALHVIQPLSFDLSDDDKVSAKAGKWASFAQSLIGKSEGTVRPHFVLGRPHQTSLQQSFERARLYLEKTSGEDNVVVEEDSRQLVDSIEEQLRSH